MPLTIVKENHFAFVENTLVLMKCGFPVLHEVQFWIERMATGFVTLATYANVRLYMWVRKIILFSWVLLKREYTIFASKTPVFRDKSQQIGGEPDFLIISSGSM